MNQLQTHSRLFPFISTWSRMSFIFFSQLIQLFLSRMLIALSNPTERLSVLKQKAVCIVYVNVNPQVANDCFMEWRQMATLRLLRCNRELDLSKRKLARSKLVSSGSFVNLGVSGPTTLKALSPPPILLSAVILELINSAGKEDPFIWCQTILTPKTFYKSFNAGILHSRKWTSWSLVLILH